MKKHMIVACALVGAAGFVGTARASVIEFRIVEVTGQTQVTFQDNTLDYAIQARVTGSGLALWGFDCLRLVGEAESASTIHRLATSNSDRTYYTGAPTVNNLVGEGGMAASYSYLAHIDGHFNGVLNTSFGTFVNTPDNEMGLLGASVGGAQMMQTPGVDPTFSGQPNNLPPGATFGPLDPAIMHDYFAKDGFIDVYRFRVVVTDFTARHIPISLVNGDARAFDFVDYNNNVWGPDVHAAGDDSLLVSGTYFDVPAPAGSALLGLGGLLGARRRRA